METNHWINHTCFECGYTCLNRRSLGNHLARSHKDIDGIMKYILKHYLNGCVPQCKCGCGNSVHWHKSEYKFNEFLSGHNAGGFTSKNQPKWTAVKIKNRTDAIKKAYAERGDEIKKKISNQVIIGSAKSGIDYAKYFKEKWQDPTFCAQQHSARVKSWQGSAGDIRREKVFTPEFGKKIGLANMLRDKVTVSKAENAFAQTLKSNGFDVQQGKWFNFPEKTWCADIWLSDHNAMVEFDGVYWHGFDRRKDFTHNQLVNITNDIKKNLLAKQHNLTLVRIKEGVDISGVKTFAELIECAYHYVNNGQVLKEGTFKIDEILPVLSREMLIRQNETDLFSDAPGRDYTLETTLPDIRDLFKAHVSYWGWFYPAVDMSELEGVKNALNKASVSASDLTVCNNTVGSKWLKSYIKSYWDVDGGPMKSFSDDKRLNAVLKYRLGLNGSKLYDYTLSDGHALSCKETFDINLKNVRFGFVVQRNCVSWFRPSTAASVYRHYLSDIQAPAVWDPSIGFSARLLGFASAFPNGTYIGTDPAKSQCDDATHLGNEFKNVTVDIRQQGSENVILQNESLDFVFTSPPYFDKEAYLDEPGQCWRDYPSIDEWTKKYLSKTLANAFNALKHDRYAVINVSGDLAELVITSALSVGFEHNQEKNLYLKLTRDHFHKKNDYNDIRSEPFLAFYKK
jgi:hypothetical protein